MEECRRMKVPVLGPDVNESYHKFSVNKDNAIRFGMGAIKGVGGSAVETVVEQRNLRGHLKIFLILPEGSIYALLIKKSFESLANAGAFDCFENTHRAQYFYDAGDGQSF